MTCMFHFPVLFSDRFEGHLSILYQKRPPFLLLPASVRFVSPRMQARSQLCLILFLFMYDIVRHNVSVMSF